MKVKLIIATPIILSSCAWLSGPDGLYPDTKYDFLQEEIEEQILMQGCQNHQLGLKIDTSYLQLLDQQVLLMRNQDKLFYYYHSLLINLCNLYMWTWFGFCKI